MLYLLPQPCASPLRTSHHSLSLSLSLVRKQIPASVFYQLDTVVPTRPRPFLIFYFAILLVLCGRSTSHFAMSFHNRASGFPPSREETYAYQPRERNEVDQTSQESALKKKSAADISLLSGSSSRTRKESRHRKAITIWWQELAAATVLCATVIASYATLAPYAGKSLPEWTRYITISALLSTYSVILRLAATFLLAEGLAQLKWR